MESVPSKKTIKGMRKVPQFEDILQEELKNAKKTMNLPFRYMFLADQSQQAASEHEKSLQDHHDRVMSEFKDHYDRRSGGTPIIIKEAVQGEQGVQGQQGPRGEQGLPGARGPPGPVDVMMSKLQEAEAVKMKAKQQELEDELSRMRIEQAKQARTASVLAEMQANLTSIPSELRALAEAQRSRPNVDVRTHLQEAAAHLGRQAQDNHEASMQFLRTNMQSLAGMASQVGGSLSKAVDKLKSEQVTNTPPPPPPPPPPDGTRIRRAESKAAPPAKASSSSEPATSSTTPSTNIFGANIFGGPAPAGYVKPKSELEIVDEMVADMKRMENKKAKAPTLVKTKTKKNIPVGVKKDSSVPDHDTKLTKHGLKPVVHKKKPEEDKPTPAVPAASEVKYNKKKRKGDHNPPTTGVKRAIAERTMPGPKRTRRVSAHAI